LRSFPYRRFAKKQTLARIFFWQEQWFVNGSLALEGKRRNEQTEEQERIEKLEKKIQQKDAVLAELMAEHVALKKELGEL
jgi:transposase